MRSFMLRHREIKEVEMTKFLSLICAEGISQAETLAFQFGAAREPELSRKA